MGLPLPSIDNDLDKLIEETEASVLNTRNFLDRIQLSEVENKRYIQQITDNLEGSLKNLKRKRDNAQEERERRTEEK